LIRHKIFLLMFFLRIYAIIKFQGMDLRRKACLALCLVLFLGRGTFSANQKIRSVKLKIVIDEEFRRNKNWRLDVSQLIRKASQSFEFKFGIRFEIKAISFWQSDNSNLTMPLLHQELQKDIAREDCDVVLGFTSQAYLGSKCFGIASYLNGYILVRDSGPESFRVMVLEHEFAHLFGAIDLNIPDSIMSKSKMSLKYPDFIRRIITLNRERSFRPYTFPLPPVDWSRMIELYEMALQQGSDDTAEAYSHLGYVYLKMNKADEAIAHCRKAVQLDPTMAEAYATLGAAYFLKQEIVPAESMARIALRINPLLPSPHIDLGNIFLAKGEQNMARLEYQAALKLDSEYCDAYYNLGRLFLLQENYIAAVDAFKKTLALNPESHRAWSNLAGANLSLGLIPEAEQACRHALILKPDHALAYYNLGFTLWLKGELKEAESACWKAFVIDPNLKKCHNLLGVLQDKKGNMPKAEEYLLSALKLDPDYFEAHLNLGNIYFKLHRFSDAALHYTKALNSNPQYYPLYNNLAAVCFYQHQYSLAWKYLLQAEAKGVKVNPDFKQGLLQRLGRNPQHN